MVCCSSSVHVLVEVLEASRVRVVHVHADAIVHLDWQGAERSVDFLGRAALLVDGEDTFFRNPHRTRWCPALRRTEKYFRVVGIPKNNRG